MSAQILKRIRSLSSSYSTTATTVAAATTTPPSEPPLVSTITSLLTHHPTKSKWTHLRSLLSSTTTTPATLTPTHFSQIALHFKSNPHLALRFFNFTLNNPTLCFHSLLSYCTIIHLLSRARLKSRARLIIRAAFLLPELSGQQGSALALFKALLRTYSQCDSAPFVFDLLIKSCLELKKIDGPVEILRMLRSRGISPQISTCNMLITSVSSCKGSYAGYRVFREVFGLEGGEAEGEAKRVVRVRPNVHSFNALMAAFYRDGEFGMVEEVWEEMPRFGCVANGCSYSVLMAVYGEGGGRMRETEELWEEMRTKGIMPDVAAYNTIISGCCRIGEMEKAEGFFREMGLSGIESSCLTFEHIINGYCRVGDVDLGMLVFKDMRRKGFSPGSLTLEALIGGLCEKKRVVEALEIMRVAMMDVCFCPSGKSYEFLIKGLCEEGKMEAALKIQAGMVGKGFKPNLQVYDAFIEGYMKLGNKEMAEMLRKEMSEAQKWQEED